MTPADQIKNMEARIKYLEEENAALAEQAKNLQAEQASPNEDTSQGS